MSEPNVFFIHAESSIYEANKSYFDFAHQDNYDKYCSEQNPDPYTLHNNNENIITMKCGHYLHKYMIITHIFPCFPFCCVTNDCLNENSQNCSVCQSKCVFVCDLCSNIVSEPNTIESINKFGIENLICNINRKRKFNDTNEFGDCEEYNNFPTKKI